MRNLEQIRSKNALTAAEKGFHGKNDGDIIKKIPAMIKQSGFLGALAYAIEDESKTKKNESVRTSGYAEAFKAILQHLQNRDIGLCPVNLQELRQFAEWLCDDEQNSIVLRTITAEAMAYMNVLRRYANLGESHANDNK